MQILATVPSYLADNFIFYLFQILHFLGNEGPKTADPSKYIRYIYNRVILENPTVRAAAVSTLSKFGATVDSLKVRFFLFCALVYESQMVTESKDF